MGFAFGFYVYLIILALTRKLDLFLLPFLHLKSYSFILTEYNLCDN